MRVPIVVGSSEKIERTGEEFSGLCPQCKRVGRFYDAKKKFNVTAFFAISLWDSSEDVEQCGACLACFEKGSIAPVEEPSSATPSLASRVVGVFKRNSANQPEVTAPARTKEKPPSKELPSRKDELAKRAADEHIDAELAALKKRMGKS